MLTVQNCLLALCITSAFIPSPTYSVTDSNSVVRGVSALSSHHHQLKQHNNTQTIHLQYQPTQHRPTRSYGEVPVSVHVPVHVRTLQTDPTKMLKLVYEFEETIHQLEEERLKMELEQVDEELEKELGETDEVFDEFQSHPHSYHDHGEARFARSDKEDLSTQDASGGIDQLFTAWKSVQGKTYTTPGEEAQHLSAFTKNVVSMDQSFPDLLSTMHQRSFSATASGPSANPNAPIFGLSPFTDIAPAEFRRTRMGYRSNTVNKATIPIANSMASIDEANGVGFAAKNLPDSFTWVGKGPVSALKNQGKCGSCWAFSAVEAVESAVYMKTKKLTLLSTQQLTSCDTVDGGCNGGDTLTAYKYIQQKGLQPYSTYPDTSPNTEANGKCSYNGRAAKRKIKGFKYATRPCTSGACVGTQNEATLAQSLMRYGPLSVCLNAAPWQNYNGKGAIVNSTQCDSQVESMNHCVQLVGWATNRHTKYWILKNQWGADWGNKGYIYLKYGENTCGLANEATTVLV